MRASHISAAVFAAALAMGTAHAADVELYGIIDTGLNFQHVDAGIDGEDATNQFQMKSSQNTPNRWGMRGTEELGNGMKVGFMLEGQFGSDDGTMTGGRLFQRAAELSLQGDFGRILFGRSGALRSGFSSTGLWAGKVSPFSNSWGDYMAGSKYIMPGGFKPLDNAITYQSPVFSGFQLHAQYSFKRDIADDQVEGKASSDRQWGVAATYTGGPLHVVFILDSVMYGNSTNDQFDDFDDSLAGSLAGVYDFGFMKLYASGMYFQGMKQSEFQGHKFAGYDAIVGKVGTTEAYSYKGYSLQVGAGIPAFGGTAKVNFGWMDGQVDQYAEKNADKLENEDIDRFTVAVGYEYPLSKRTTLYGGMGYVKESSNNEIMDDPTAYEAVAGLIHRF